MRGRSNIGCSNSVVFKSRSMTIGLHSVSELWPINPSVVRSYCIAYMKGRIIKSRREHGGSFYVESSSPDRPQNDHLLQWNLTIGAMGADALVRCGHKRNIVEMKIRDASVERIIDEEYLRRKTTNKNNKISTAQVTTHDLNVK